MKITYYNNRVQYESPRTKEYYTVYFAGSVQYIQDNRVDFMVVMNGYVSYRYPDGYLIMTIGPTGQLWKSKD